MYNAIADKLIEEYKLPVRSSFQGEWHITVDFVAGDNYQVYINTIYVPTEHRHTGAGKRIVELIESAAIENGYKATALYAFPYSDGEGNTKAAIEKLVRWYQSQGYKLEYENDFESWIETAEEKLYSYDDVIDIVGMYKELN